ncbi:MAG: hypothetical protein IKQ10_01690 [Oscillospiraceae bacterium]|nr:hypothetical protein [Oscillospiraceae bacterium]
MEPLRHAYLIMTHGSFPILEKQLRFLDSENADFYVHVDAKTRGVDFAALAAIPRRSRVVFTERLDVRWGAFSQVEGELVLLRAAVEGRYDYYHLLSGVDVPLKSREYIERYFSERNGTNFIKFQSPEISARDLARVKYYYPLQELNVRSRWLRVLLRELTVLPQKLAGVDRTKKAPGIVFHKGTNWFSITDAMARYVLEREPKIRAFCRQGLCTDEVFLQTAAASSPYRDTLAAHAFENDFRACCRYIDWERGSPYTFTDSDFDELAAAGPDFLFARKFDYDRYPGVVDRLFARFGGEGGEG